MISRARVVRAEAGDPLLGGGVGPEQVGEPHLATGERVHDVGLGLGRGDVHRDPPRGDLELLERPGERLAGAEELGPGAVRLELAAAAEQPSAAAHAARGEDDFRGENAIGLVSRRSPPPAPARSGNGAPRRIGDVMGPPEPPLPRTTATLETRLPHAPAPASAARLAPGPLRRPRPAPPPTPKHSPPRPPSQPYLEQTRYQQHPSQPPPLVPPNNQIPIAYQAFLYPAPAELPVSPDSGSSSPFSPQSLDLDSSAGSEL